MCQMVAEHQEKSIWGLLSLGKQAYQPANNASDSRSWIFTNPASSSQFIQYFIFILISIIFPKYEYQTFAPLVFFEDA